MKDKMMDRASPASIAITHETGFMKSHIFVMWLEHFLKPANPSEARSVLLILDDHKTHTNNLPFIEMARANFVTVICLQPHCSNRMQRLDVSFMKPLTTYCTQAVECWLQSHPGRVLSTFQIAELFGRWYVRAATVRTAVNGFRKTGIWLIDLVSNKQDFAAALPTDVVRQPNTDAPPPTKTPMRYHVTETSFRHHVTETPMRHHVTESPSCLRRHRHASRRRTLHYWLFRRYPESTKLQSESNKEREDLHHYGQPIQDRTRGQRETGNLPTTKLKQFKEERAHDS